MARCGLRASMARYLSCQAGPISSCFEPAHLAQPGWPGIAVIIEVWERGEIMNLKNLDEGTRLQSVALRMNNLIRLE
jgi:hypothetical protein